MAVMALWPAASVFAKAFAVVAVVAVEAEPALPEILIEYVPELIALEKSPAVKWDAVKPEIKLGFE